MILVPDIRWAVSVRESGNTHCQGFLPAQWKKIALVVVQNSVRAGPAPSVSTIQFPGGRKLFNRKSLTHATQNFNKTHVPPRLTVPTFSAYYEEILSNRIGSRLFFLLRYWKTSLYSLYDNYSFYVCPIFSNYQNLSIVIARLKFLWDHRGLLVVVRRRPRQAIKRRTRCLPARFGQLS